MHIGHRCIEKLTARNILMNRNMSGVCLDAFSFDGQPVDVTLVDGEFRLKICREGGKRLFDATGQVRLLQNRPNPFNAMTTIEYEIIEKVPTRLFVLDLLGREVAVQVDGIIEPGAYRVSFDASQLASGMYLCVLATPTAVLTRGMGVAK